ncbi:MULTISPECIES: hypothetical protein [Roseivirga]|jgi:hypothetical protein|uniref:DUF4252 domain-containing protein n=1 Tax=Roseivirga thermotolerans TaxID=1758176 RepID=A0ABQ3I3W3_9BACT|nr:MULTISPECIES: hypothetical protein [Roseivirga]MEC7753060.1 hypothetical protein [Bacteroidota bacterium]GHE52274.1 hypothetical protein GCM10011340_03140 [Roseivirga thermotolerans]|tara:strand:- start:7579 stop:8172 length:594 start_codon:yes stop_codon:yes gene_type:complete
MKKVILIGLLTVCSVALSAQQLNPKDASAIDSQVSQFLTLIKQRNYTQVLDFMYPPVFEHTSKKDMFQVFELLEQSGIELKFKNMEVLDKKALPTVKESKYALIKYNLEMELPLTTDDLRGIAPLLVPALQSNFGKENVVYNKSQNYINVKGQKFLMGIHDPKYNKWLFLIYDDSFKSAIEKTIPAEVNKKAAAVAY